MWKRQPFISVIHSESEICEAIGKRIRDVREHRKLSIEELSKSSNLAVSAIIEAETKGEVTLRDLVKIGIALKSDAAPGLEMMFKVPRFSTIEEYSEFCKNDKGTANMFDLINSLGMRTPQRG